MVVKSKIFILSLLLFILPIANCQLLTVYADEPLKLALYLPQEYFSDPMMRISFIEQLAEFLSKQGKLNVKGQSFVKAEDLENAILNGKVDFAILDAVYTAKNIERLNLMPFVVCNRLGKKSTNFALWVKKDTYKNLYDLKGKKIAISDMGGNEEKFISNILLEGEIDASLYFSSFIKTKDVNSALLSVLYGQSDGAIAQDIQYSKFDSKYGELLVKLFTTRDVLLPVMVYNKTKVKSSDAEKIKELMIEMNTSEVGLKILSLISINSWKSIDISEINQINYLMLLPRKDISKKIPSVIEPEQKENKIEEYNFETKIISIQKPKSFCR